MACRILVPQPGIKPVPPALEAWSLNPWTAREVPRNIFFYPFTFDLAIIENSINNQEGREFYLSQPEDCNPGDRL